MSKIFPVSSLQKKKIDESCFVAFIVVIAIITLLFLHFIYVFVRVGCVHGRSENEGDLRVHKLQVICLTPQIFVNNLVVSFELV